MKIVPFKRLAEISNGKNDLILQTQEGVELHIYVKEDRTFITLPFGNEFKSAKEFAVITPGIIIIPAAMTESLIHLRTQLVPGTKIIVRNNGEMLNAIVDININSDSFYSAALDAYYCRFTTDPKQTIFGGCPPFDVEKNAGYVQVHKIKIDA